MVTNERILVRAVRLKKSDQVFMAADLLSYINGSLCRLGKLDQRFLNSSRVPKLKNFAAPKLFDWLYENGKS